MNVFETIRFIQFVYCNEAIYKLNQHYC